MEEKKIIGTESLNDNTSNDNKSEPADVAGQLPSAQTPPKKRSGIVLKLFIFLAAAVLAGLGGYWYYWNLPEQRMARAFEEARVLMQAEEYEAAAGKFREVLEIDSSRSDGMEGYMQALTAAADEEAAAAEDIPSLSRAGSRYEELAGIAEEAAGTTDSDLPDHTREYAAGKAQELRDRILKLYQSVTCTTARDDRSETISLPDKEEIPYTRYYDLVQIEDEYYPLADMINGELARARDDFFEDGRIDPSSVIKDMEGGPVSSFMDYAGENGIYSENGLLSIRIAEIQSFGSGKSCFFRGRTYRLEDGKQLFLTDLTGRTDSGIRHLVKKRLRNWLEQEGYTSVSMSDMEDYVEETDPEDYKFFIREDGEICLVIDQEAPFFAAFEDILEIPLEQETE